MLDSTYALGDGDTDGESEAADADELSDEQLDGLEGDADEDDLDDDNAEMGESSTDDITDFAADSDAEDEDLADGVAAHSPDEADVIAMGDINDLAALGDGPRDERTRARRRLRRGPRRARLHGEGIGHAKHQHPARPYRR